MYAELMEERFEKCRRGWPKMAQNTNTKTYTAFLKDDAAEIEE
jgi:phosphoheptose isomerase